VAAESAATIVSILDLIVSLLLPKTKGLSLEELSTSAESAAVAAEQEKRSVPFRGSK
jgi:hypothetical protein